MDTDYRPTDRPEPETLARARALVPVVAAAAPRIEAGKELPADLIGALHDAKMFRMLLPAWLDGAELEPPSYLEVLRTIAQGDASTAWCLNQTSVCSITSIHLPRAVAQQVWGPRDGVLAWGIGPASRAVPVEGGYTITGTWGFGSGSRHAGHVGAHCMVFEPDGKPRLHADGKQVELTMVIPKSVCSIDPRWDVLGLRGTGSDAYTVKDLFVDEAHTCVHLSRWHEATRPEFALCHRFGATSLYAAGFASVSCGNARTVLNDFIVLAGGKTPRGHKNSLRDSNVVQMQIAQWEMQLRSAWINLLDLFRTCRDSVAAGGGLTMDQRMLIRAAATWLIHQSTAVVEGCYRAAGTTAVFESNPFERRFRDAYTISQHLQGRAAHFETVGKHILGLEPEPLFL
jgi:alkylation response protein AidB-like acyl-CoA dehydrogenase